ncbi:MAG: hypothetical protein J6Z80_06405 [Clostridia bacterium]|nr:hypothetical protein [Clostridia bacterium]
MKKIIICALAVIIAVCLASCQIIETIKNLGSATETDKPADPAATTAEGKATETGNVTDPATQSETDVQTEPAQSETEPYIDPAPQLIEENLIKPDTFALYDDMLYIGSCLLSVSAGFDDTASELTPTQAFLAIYGETEYDSTASEDMEEDGEYRMKTTYVYSQEKIDAGTQKRFGCKYNLSEIDYEKVGDLGDTFTVKYDASNNTVVVTSITSPHGGVWTYQECELLKDARYSDGGVIYSATIGYYEESDAPPAGEDEFYRHLEYEGYDAWYNLVEKYVMTFVEIDGSVRVISFWIVSNV